MFELEIEIIVIITYIFKCFIISLSIFMTGAWNFGGYWMFHQSLHSLYFYFVQNPNPIPCPNGTFSQKPGLRDPSDCTICPVGMYCFSQQPQEHPITEPVSHFSSFSPFLYLGVLLKKQF